ncbi:MAG: sugar phosphate isomerase/epimerase [Desulfobacterales bacterium]|nr:MAG: sugar phosphate isomerase/epimerase [Desulfobacterales bacterium]
MIPTLFSVSYAGLWGQDKLDLEAFIKKAAALGYAAVELMAKRPHLSILDAGAERIARIKRCARDNNIKIVTIAGYTDFSGGRKSAEVPFVEMQIAYVQKLSEMAQQLEAGIVRVFTGYATGDEVYQDDWQTCVQAIRECAGRAERCGVFLGVQNHHDTAVSTDAFIEFLNDVDHPNCKAMFDPWSPALQGEDLYACARKMAPHMVQTTIADYVRLKRWAYMPGLVNYRQMPAMVRAVPVGQGFIDLASFFKGLREGGFTGPVAYEMCSPLRGGGSEDNLDKTAAKSLYHIRALINGSG